MHARNRIKIEKTFYALARLHGVNWKPGTGVRQKGREGGREVNRARYRERG